VKRVQLITAGKVRCGQVRSQGAGSPVELPVGPARNLRVQPAAAISLSGPPPPANPATRCGTLHVGYGLPHGTRRDLRAPLQASTSQEGEGRPSCRARDRQGPPLAVAMSRWCGCAGAAHGARATAST
jgi:hypothetical protein